MCYYCHTMGLNREAPPHRSKNCRDKGNHISQVPIQNRIYEQGKRIDQYSSCKICHSNKPNMAFIPCGHVSTCETCVLKVEICPICNQAITNRQKLFFP